MSSLFSGEKASVLGVMTHLLIPLSNSLARVFFKPASVLGVMAHLPISLSNSLTQVFFKPSF